MIKDIAFVGYPVADMARARAFYEGVLGLVADPEFGGNDVNAQWVEYPVGTGTLTLGKMDGWKPSKDGPSMALEVADLDALIATLKAHNISFYMEKTDFPACSMAICIDTEGNTVALHQKK